MMLHFLLVLLFVVVCSDALENALVLAVLAVVLVATAMVPFDFIIIDTDSGV
jgi:hypothetical protein